jgi:replicative DNA helicase
MTTDNFVNGADLIDDWRHDVLNGSPPKRYDLGGDDFSHLRLGPGTVALIGGSPGMGKTAFAMQCAFKAMAADPTLTVCVANVEMPPHRLLERQLSRLSGVLLDHIQDRRLSPRQKNRLRTAFDALESLMDRVVFVKAPFTLSNVAEACDSLDAELIVLDYIQRIRPSGTHEDKRGSIDATMDSIRQFAEDGRCVLAMSAVGRSKDARGRSSYAGNTLSLASFRESSELEYGADDAYLLVPSSEWEQDTDDATVAVSLKQLKCRYGKPTDLELIFDRALQSFSVVDASAFASRSFPESLTELCAPE